MSLKGIKLVDLRAQLMPGVNNVDMLQQSDASFSRNWDEANIRRNKEFVFWENSLGDMIVDRAIIMTTWKDGELTKVSTESIIKSCINLNIINNLSQYFVLANPKFHFIKFESFEAMDVFKEGCVTLEESNIIYLEDKTHKNEFMVTIENVPPHIVEKEVVEFLDEFGKVSDIECKKIVLPSGKFLETAPVTFSIKLNNGCMKKDIPTVFEHNNVKSVLKIKGKGPICFRCGVEGHFAKACVMKFCVGCRKMEMAEHKCVMTYAGRLKLNQSVFKEWYEQNKDKMVADVSTGSDCEYMDSSSSIGGSVMGKGENKEVMSEADTTTKRQKTK